MLQESIGLLFSIQNNSYYLQLHKVGNDDETITGNTTAELNDHIYLYQTRDFILTGKLYCKNPKVFLTIQLY